MPDQVGLFFWATAQCERAATLDQTDHPAVAQHNADATVRSDLGPPCRPAAARGQGALLAGRFVVGVELEDGGEVVGGEVVVVRSERSGAQPTNGADHLVTQADPGPGDERPRARRRGGSEEVIRRCPTRVDDAPTPSFGWQPRVPAEAGERLRSSMSPTLGRCRAGPRLAEEEPLGADKSATRSDRSNDVRSPRSDARQRPAHRIAGTTASELDAQPEAATDSLVRPTRIGSWRSRVRRRRDPAISCQGTGRHRTRRVGRGPGPNTAGGGITDQAGHRAPRPPEPVAASRIRRSTARPSIQRVFGTGMKERNKTGSYPKIEAVVEKAQRGEAQPDEIVKALKEIARHKKAGAKSRTRGTGPMPVLDELALTLDRARVAASRQEAKEIYEAAGAGGGPTKKVAPFKSLTDESKPFFKQGTGSRELRDLYGIEVGESAALSTYTAPISSTSTRRPRSTRRG